MTHDRISESITVRSAVAGDDAFLYELYRSTRSEEIAALGWDSAQEQSFLKLQFTAQRRHHEIAFPKADHRIILSGNRPIGRILVFKSASEIRLVDIALLPAHRGSGIGASLIRRLSEEARSEGKPVTLHVGKSNRAAGLYQRLGFSITGDIGTDYKMEWRPD